jgi:outer membrane immunogenic protein
MKKVMVGVTVALALVTSKAAADGIDRRPPPAIAAAAVPIYVPSWSGFYIGAGIGAGAAITDVNVNHEVFGTLHDFRGGADGVLGTLIIGYDWQLGPRTVLGVFADFDFFDMQHRHRTFDGVLFDAPFDHRVHHENAWSIGARLGWLSSPSTLWYFTAGYTQLQAEHRAGWGDTVAFDGFDGFDGFGVRRDRQLDGYFLGGGVDTRLAGSNWFLRLEYRWSDYDSHRFRLFDDEFDTRTRIDVDTQTHTARLTLTYKFTPGPWGGMGAGTWGP